MNRIVTMEGLSNREFLESCAQPGRIGLAGGTTLIDKAINRAQRHVDPRKVWSHWSHAFLFSKLPAPADAWESASGDTPHGARAAAAKSPGAPLADTAPERADDECS